ncbi:ribosomal RNA small subunit methyltransferase A [Bacteroidia bacterium]|nr:ribosomal RNA small subunit methyltransferase A [Bacteroidia bacterium]
MFIRAKKSLGQHFLTDKNIARKITDSLLPVSDNILEIGAGMGVLTQFLFEKSGLHIKTIDIDNEAIAYLQTRWPEQQDAIFHGDFLEMDCRQFFQSSFSIIGNFPYHISSQIFFKVLENRELIPQIVCMIQKEVAERIAAVHGNKTYGILSVFLQTFFHIEYLFTVNENVFAPPPKVKSAVIRLIRNERTQLDCNESLFFSVVKSGFNQRRKTLRNSLKQLLPPDFTSDYLSMRPEQLSPEDFITLTKSIETQGIHDIQEDIHDIQNTQKYVAI